MSNENVFDTLMERGFIEQATHEKEIRDLFGRERVTFYIGYDPTADSLTVGHFLTVMAMMHLQRAGHRPIALMGGGTGMIGDPTDRTDMRRIMTTDEIDHNVSCFKGQMARFIDFGEDQAVMVNNADWLRHLNYVEFLRDIGVHFSVNRMLTYDCFKTRMEKGLSFLEFNYMLLQSYDFLELYRRYGCKMQLGGNDQWSNIIAGADLIRRVDGGEAFGMTFTLLTNSEGKKMGKTQKGAIWIDESKTTPYEFFQYWRNIDDADVKKCLSLLTFLPMDEVNRLSALRDSEINIAKETLAFEITKNVHGESKADEARKAARALFSGGSMDGSIPTTEIKARELIDMDIISLCEKCGLISSKSDGRRLISQGGLKLSEKKIEAFDYKISEEDIADGILMIQKGKKVFHRVKILQD